MSCEKIAFYFSIFTLGTWNPNSYSDKKSLSLNARNWTMRQIIDRLGWTTLTFRVKLILTWFDTQLTERIGGGVNVYPPHPICG